MTSQPLRAGGTLRALALAAAACMQSGPVSATDIDTGNPDLAVRWDTDLKYSAAWRLKHADAALLLNPNTDDGDRNFGKGLISNRVDVFSEFDAIYAKRNGVRVSAAGWYDEVYNRRNDNPGFAGGAYPNQNSVAYDRFTDPTRRIHGRDAEVLDAFAFTGFDLGDTKLNLRLGQFGQVWGESLFFGTNAIAGAMSPVDVVKLISVPGTQFKEGIRPVPQVSAQWQLRPDVSLGAYYQFRFRSNRLPAVGSYFSGVDTNPAGAEQLLLGPTTAPRLADQDPRRGGQGGVQLRFQLGEVDYGLYAIRFDDHSFQQVLNMGGTPSALSVDSYQLAYHQGIYAFGGSASRTFGDVNLAIEGSVRHNQDLASTRAVDLSGVFGGPASDDDKNPAYAVGRTAHVNLSGIWTMPQLPIYHEATFTFELMWNRALEIDKNASAVDPNSTRDAEAARFLFEPQYRQVISGLDLSIPFGVGYSPHGSRSRALGLGFPAEGGGDLSLGINGTYLQEWHVSLAYTHFMGRAESLLDSANAYSYQQYLADRDFVSFAVHRTF